MGKLFVGSVFADHPRSAKWYEIQLRALDHTVGAENYSHFVIANGCKSDIFGRSHVTSIDPHPEPAVEHVRGLRTLCNLYQGIFKDYDGCLLLDSDAFPFVPGWRSTLEAWMGSDERLPERKWASVVRVENLDTFPHPCVVYAKGDYLVEHSLPFFAMSHKNLLGFSFSDVTCCLPTCELDNQIWLPMTRTNVWNPHPILAGIYGGLFYHHGAGSRWVELRSVSLRQFDHHFPRYLHHQREAELWAEVSMNPLIFAKQLSQMDPR